MNTPKIMTHHNPPPRSFDWCAWVYGEEELGVYGYGKTEAEAVDWCAWVYGEEELGVYGYGKTEAEAVADLKEQLEDAC